MNSVTFPAITPNLRRMLHADMATAPWHVRLQIHAREGGGQQGQISQLLCRFFSRRLQSNWSILQRFLSQKPMGMVFSVNKTHPRTCTINPSDATYRSYYAPRAPGYLEPEVLSLLPILLPNNGVFYDVGANWGFYTHIVGQLPNFTGTIHTFEANPAVATTTARIAAELELKNTTIHPFGLSNQNASARMGGMGRTGDTSTGQVGAGDIEIDVKILDDLNLPKPHLMKLDVEDHEFEALSGMKTMLKAAMPHILIESWGPAITPKVDTTYPALTLLENLGYVFFNPQVTNGQLTLTPITLEARKQNVKLINLLALHSSKLVDVQKI